MKDVKRDKEGVPQMTEIRLRPIALIVIVALCLTFLPLNRPVYADSTATPAWQLGLVVGLMAGFATYLFWSVFREGRVSQREFDRERREQYIREHKELEPPKKKAILNGRLIRFMIPDEVYASWGRPNDTMERETNTGSEVHWVWPRGSKRILHAFFLNGYLDRWHEEIVEDED
jgi:hypothetical protein